MSKSKYSSNAGKKRIVAHTCTQVPIHGLLFLYGVLTLPFTNTESATFFAVFGVLVGAIEYIGH